MSISNIKSLYDHFSDELAWSNVFINFERSSASPNSADVSKKRVERISDIGSDLSELIDRNGRRVLMVYMPSLEKDLLTDPRILDRLGMYWNAASLKKSEYRKMKTISELLLDNNSLRIKSGKYSELNIRFDSSQYVLNAGPFTQTQQRNHSYSIPSGDLTVLPIENEINGYFICEACGCIAGSISGVRLRIENNIVVDAQTDKGIEQLNSMLSDYGTAGRTVSQICFGLNSEVKSAELLPDIGNLLYGSVSISFGSNTMLEGNIADPQPWSVISVSPEVRSGNELILSNNEYHCK